MKALNNGVEVTRHDDSDAALRWVGSAERSGDGGAAPATTTVAEAEVRGEGRGGVWGVEGPRSGSKRNPINGLENVPLFSNISWTGGFGYLFNYYNKKKKTLNTTTVFSYFLF